MSTPTASSTSGGGTTTNSASASASATTAPASTAVSTLAKEVSHYVVTAHPPGGVLFTCKGHFVPDHAGSNDVIVAKSRRLEVRTWHSSSSPGSSTSGTSTDATMTNNDNSKNNAKEEAEKTSLFPVLASVPLNGRLTSLLTIKLARATTDYIFVTTDRHQYAVLSYAPNARPYPFQTHASGRLPSGEDPALLGRPSESGPLVAVDPHFRCIALHWLDGLITILTIDQNYIPPPAPTNTTTTATSSDAGGASQAPAYWPKSTSPKMSCLKEPFHVRMEERTLLNMVFLSTPADNDNNSGNNGGGGRGGATTVPQPQLPPQLTLLHQDSRGTQHVYTHSVDLRKHALTTLAGSSSNNNNGSLKRSRVDGGSSHMIPVPASRPIVAGADDGTAATTGGTTPSMLTLGGVIVLGQRQITYANATTTKVTPVPPCLFLSWDTLPDDPKGMPRYLLADEFGNLHMLSFLTYHARIVALTLETLGSCALCHTCQYLGDGLTFVGSTLGDSQLVQIHEEPIRNDASGGPGGPGGGGVNASALSAAAIGATDTIDEPSVANTEDAQATDMEWMVDSTYLTVVEEYTHLGPIVDFDLVPTAPGLAASSSNANQQHQPSQVVTASGTSRAGSIRLIRNGIGMNEYASVEMPGIQAMWSVRDTYASTQDAYLVQSFVGQTRVLGVTTVEAEGSHEGGDDDSDEDEAGGTLEEVMLDGLDANATSLYIGNVQPGDGLLQITENEVRLISLSKNGVGGLVLDTWTPPDISLGDRPITVAAGNEAGQAVVATRGGTLWYLVVNDEGSKVESLHTKQMDNEVSCLDVHPFASKNAHDGNDSMQIDASASDGAKERAFYPKSNMVAVGLWDDFTVRLLSLTQELEELQQVHLSTDEEDEEEDSTAMLSAEESAVARRHRNNMMARSLCLVSLDVSNSSNNSSGGSGGHSSSNGSQGIDMLFVGLGDGTVVSFAVVVSTTAGNGTKQQVSIQSKKEVCLGTQRISLIPLRTEWGGTCVLATGDRPTVIYLAGIGSGAISPTTGAPTSFNPKLCYSNVNLQVSEDDEAEHVSRSASQQSIAVNVAAPFFSSLLFDAGSLGTQYYSLCVADDANLRLGVIDDIQKLHVTTCRLGMAPRRIVHCPEGRMFAVGCIESGIKQLGLGGEEHNMGNCIRFLDDTTFDDIERINLEPYEMILSMTYASLRVHSSSATSADAGKTGEGSGDGADFRNYLMVGTAYALPDEDEPTRGRIMLISCGGGGGVEEEAAGTSNNARAVRHVTELQVRGGVYSMTQFFDGKVLAAVNSKTQICILTDEGNAGGMKLSFVGVGHHGHILTMFVKSQAGRTPTLAASAATAQGDATGSASAGSSSAIAMDVDDPGNKKKAATVAEKDMLAIVGDLMRSISVVQYYPQHETLEEIARDFNTNWTTAIEMLTDDVYLGAENWNNLFVLRRNTKSQSEEIRCRLDTIGEFHLGEMCNKFMKGSLVMPHSSNSATSARKAPRRASVQSPAKRKTSDATGNSPSKSGHGSGGRARRPPVVIGSQTLFGTVEGTLGCILGLDVRTAAFFSCIERAMTKVIRPVGDFSHQQFRSFDAERRVHPAHGFVDGDLIESFLDMDRPTMEAVVHEMNRDGAWEVDRGTMSSAGGRDGSEGDKNDSNPDADSVDHPELVVEDVVAMVEEMAMLH